MHTEVRKVWITKGTRPVIPRQIRYEWDYLYGALEVVKGEAEFLHLPTVNLACNKLFLEHLKNSDPEAQHVVIADQAGFHLKAGDKRLPQGVHILSLPPYSPELNPCEQLWDILKDTEGFDRMCNFILFIFSDLFRFQIIIMQNENFWNLCTTPKIRRNRHMQFR